MSGRDMWGSDDPNRVGDEDYQSFDSDEGPDPDDAYDRQVEEEMAEAKPYGGSLIADCAASETIEDCFAKIAELAEANERLTHEIRNPGPSIFEIAKARTAAQSVQQAFAAEFGDGKQESRERLMGYDRNAPSYYSEFGR